MASISTDVGQMSWHRDQPQPSVGEPRRHLLAATLAFVVAAWELPGVRRIALIGSLTTNKPVPKDTDLLVVIDDNVDFEKLAMLGRRLKGTTQSINLGADIFLADHNERYIGRICRYRECFPRVLCEARHCGQRNHLNDDLDLVTLAQSLIAAPPVDLRPGIVVRCAVPEDVEALLLQPLAAMLRH